MRTRLTVVVIVIAAGCFAVPSPVGASSREVTFSDFAPKVASSHQTPVTVGDKPWVVLLCRFSDIPDTPEALGYFQNLFSSSYPGLAAYWNEVSLGKMSLAGTKAHGWFDMKGSYGSYGLPGENGFTVSWNEIVKDCMAAADGAVFFPEYAGVMVMLNYRASAAASVGAQPYTIDGATRTYFTTVMPAPPATECSCPDDSAGWNKLAVMAHEMGHGLGFHHSSGPYAKVYDSNWDSLSEPGPRDPSGACRVDTGSYGCAPVHTLAHNKAAAGWIDPGQVTTVVGGDSADVVLQPSDAPAAGQMLIEVVLPADGSGHVSRLTIEARRKVGWDAALPGEGVVIHTLGPLGGNDGSTDAMTVDPDGDGDPNDDGAIWTPGETYTHQSGATISVTEKVGDGYRVMVNNPLPTGLRNDERSPAVVIEGRGFSYRQDVGPATAGTSDVKPSCAQGPLSNTVWYSYQATQPHDVVFTVAADGFSPTVVVYRESAETSCTSVPAGVAGRIRLTPEFRRRYSVMIGSSTPTAGTVTVSMSQGVSRTVVMKLTRHLQAAGSVSADQLLCSQGQRVEIQKKTGTKWTRVTSATTKANGTFVKKVPDKAGTYRALAMDSFIDNDYACLSAAARSVSHRH